jgi:RES domain
MIRDAELLDRLAGMPVESFAGQTFRATRQNHDPLAPSTYGGRWMPSGGAAVLYTSTIRDGAMAEIAFHLSRQTPLPTKPIFLHILNVVANKTLRLLRTDLTELGVNEHAYTAINYGPTQQVGDAVQFLEFDGLIAPSARWNCDNLILFPDNMRSSALLELDSSESIDWLAWAQAKGFLDAD